MNAGQSKTSQQTPILQPRSQSPSAIIRDVSPTPLSPKPSGSGVATLRGQFDSAESSPSISTNKSTPRAKSPTTAVSIENSSRHSSTPSKSTGITPNKEPSPTPNQSVKSIEKSKPVESIPQFYFPTGKTITPAVIDAQLTKQLRQIKEEVFMTKHDKLHLEDFGRVAQVKLILLDQ